MTKWIRTHYTGACLVVDMVKMAVAIEATERRNGEVGGCQLTSVDTVANAGTTASQHYKHRKSGFNNQHEEHPRPPIYNAVVSKSRPGTYHSIMEALVAAPTHSKTKYYIHVEAGVYVEHIEVWQNLTNIVLVGNGASTTKVQWNRHVPEYSTSNSGTICVKGDGFIAKLITFENTASDGSQAAAAVTEANHVAYYQCSFLAYHDTLYAKSGIQFYRDCHIYGTVDFIFGASAAVFQSCNIYARLPHLITFTAQNKGATDPSGFVIHGCTLTVAPGLEQLRPQFTAYLGRPWSANSTVVVMESYLDRIVEASGWLGWGNTSTDGVAYMEYNNRGPGAGTNERVNWSGYEDVSGHPEKVKSFTVGEFINKDGWLAATGVPFFSSFLN